MTSSVHYDPRMGDESEDEAPPPERPHHHPHPAERHVKLNMSPQFEDEDARHGHDGPSTDADLDRMEKQEKAEENKRSPRANKMAAVGSWVLKHIPFDFSWIPKNFVWSKIKPAIRVAVVAWISLLFVIILRLEQTLGQASFLILVACVLMPPNLPFIAVFEQEITLMIFITIAWAWACLGLFLANLARNRVVPNAPLSDIITGQYIEAGPSVIQSVFLFVGSTFFLFLKARFGPGPFLAPTILACICLDVCLSTASLFPYAFYKIGRSIVVPLSIHAALALLAAAVVFPSTITAQYASSIQDVLDPVGTALDEHRKTLKLDPSSDEFKASVETLKGLVNTSEGGLTAAGVWFRLLQRDIIWGRFAPADLGSLQWWIRRIVTRSEGMNIYFTLIDPTREKFPVTPAPTVPSTPTRIGTPASSRPPSRLGDRHLPTDPGQYTPSMDSRETGARRRKVGNQTRPSTPLHAAISRHFHNSMQRHRADHDNHMHLSLLHFAHSLSQFDVPSQESAVGVFESQRYLTLESSRLTYPRSPEVTDQFTKLLSQSCDELLEGCQQGLTNIRQWLAGVRKSDWGSRWKVEQRRKDRLKCMETARDELNAVIERFRKNKRHRVLDPYRCAFDPKHVRGPEGVLEAPPHKYLFQCYLYEYHVWQLSVLITGLLDEIIRLEQERKKARLWIPTFRATVFFWWSRWNGSQDMDRDDDEDPDVVQMFDMDGSDETHSGTDLGQTKRRDPDALPPSNVFELVMYWLYHGCASLAGGNALFAVKAGLLTVLLSLPYHIRSSAKFAYEQHFVWGIFIGQLTIARFRGDTTFGLFARIVATFFGGLLGTVMWYISTGNGRGNPYGLAAVCGVVFPFLFFARLYWPGPPVSNMIFCVTAILVIGFSWQDLHFPSGFFYFGINVSWRRFVVVTAGVTAAFFASFLPPSTTLRGYQRRMMSTTVAEIGGVYCSVVSFANTQSSFETDRGAIIQSLIAIRLKLKRSLVLRTNIVYEFSLRGKWPAERYHKILEIQLQLAYLLSHLMSVAEHLEPAWRRAFLRRTRFLDADFQGDVLAIISMISTALRTGNPLPQITPCPLLDRYMQNQHGLNVIRNEADDDYGLPRTMTIDTLANEQYLCFSVGCTTAFGIVMRLDRLMLATKELVGEQYHIHGVGLTSYGQFAANPSHPIRPVKDV